MVFVFKKWDEFCKRLQQKGKQSIPAREVTVSQQEFLVLKHDVETNVAKAYKLAKIEHKYGHRGSYYVQAYLMDRKKNIRLLRKMQEWGNEISYHHDVMDSNQGNLDNAMEEFERNKQKFEEAGFIVETVCQHGNPIVNRKGYTSNRDFFRSDKAQKTYFNISDIMVNYATVKDVSYTYYSDAGREFKMIYDPFTNDLTYSEDRNISYNNLREVLTVLNDNACNIISTHPHRWTGSHFVYICQLLIFKIVKFAAKCLVKIPFCKKFIERHYDMAKKF